MVIFSYILTIEQTLTVTQAHHDLPPRDRSTQQDLIHLFICNLHFWSTRGCGTTTCTAPSNFQEEDIKNSPTELNKIVRLATLLQ